ncbi:lipopolysaccharide transport periplasmic protein LptA [Allohahella marinimesophila]|uniref:Lipopolysaccharide export system protein LptA n=2 Tax=Allohahella marinimesophila TaxID=1054972 RepID=A0ABP7PYH9_9GAMM
MRPSSAAKVRLRFGLTLAFIMVSGSAAAFDMTLQSREPIRIQADSAELDELKGVATYNGDVVISQGRSLIEASRITVYTTGGRGISRLDAVGTPAHLKQYNAEEDTETNAYAKRIDYRRDQNQVALRGSARLEQDSSIFQGEEILYDTVSQVVNARSSDDKDKKQRVEMVYFPETPDDEGETPESAGQN